MKCEICVTYCGDCRFYFKSMDGMQCDHPAFAGKAYAGMIFSQDDMAARTPPNKCPLRNSSLTITYKLAGKEEQP